MRRKELNIFRAMLNRQLEQLAQKSTGVVSELLAAPIGAADPIDRATLEMEREMAVHLADRNERLMIKIRKALGKIDEGSYGICEECGEDIDIARLKLRPVTELCIRCKVKQERIEKLTCEQD